MKLPLFRILFFI